MDKRLPKNLKLSKVFFLLETFVYDGEEGNFDEMLRNCNKDFIPFLIKAYMPYKELYELFAKRGPPFFIKSFEGESFSVKSQEISKGFLSQFDIDQRDGRYILFRKFEINCYIGFIPFNNIPTQFISDEVLTWVSSEMKVDDENETYYMYTPREKIWKDTKKEIMKRYYNPYPIFCMENEMTIFLLLVHTLEPEHPLLGKENLQRDVFNLIIKMVRHNEYFDKLNSIDWKSILSMGSDLLLGKQDTVGFLYIQE